MQRTSDALQSIADLYDDHVSKGRCLYHQEETFNLSKARRTQLATHESLKGVSHPSSLYDGVIATHRSTVTRYREATSDSHVCLSGQYLDVLISLFLFDRQMKRWRRAAKPC